MIKTIQKFAAALLLFRIFLSCAYAGSGFELLPQKQLFGTLVAVPRQCQIQLGMRYFDNTFKEYDENFQAPDDYRILYGIGTIAVGYPLSLIQFNLPDKLKLQAGISGGIWSVFGTRYISGPQFNSDYKICLPVALASDQWTMQLSLYHISCHVGDELIVNNEDFERLNLSREVIDYYFMYNIMRKFKTYAGAAVTVHSDRSYNFKQFYFEYGVECRPFDPLNSDSLELFMTPFIAFNMRNDQQFNWDYNLTVCAGVEFNCFNNTNCSLYRIFCEYYHGHSLEGQFLTEKTNYFSINISYGF